VGNATWRVGRGVIRDAAQEIRAHRCQLRAALLVASDEYVGVAGIDVTPKEDPGCVAGRVREPGV
jgi:hypothetical protein